MTTSIDTAFDDLVRLVSHGSRFHGTTEMAAAGDWLEGRLVDAGLTVTRQPVSLPGWHPGSVRRLAVTAPIDRAIPAWPMLWSGSSDGPRRGTVVASGPQGLWGDSMVWRKFTVVDQHGQVAAYLHARDDGPAAPQPLPAGSDLSLPHFAIGHVDGLQLQEWLGDDRRIDVEFELDSAQQPLSTSDNLIVDIAAASAADPAGGVVVICAHYDSFFNTVGAYDNGSGTVALLHLAQSWAETAPHRSLRLIFFTAEEWHLGGSRYYVEQAGADELAAIDFLINIDGLGRGSFLEAFASPEAFESEVRGAVMSYAAVDRPELALVSRFPPTKGTDDAAFAAAGVPTAFITFNDLHRLHQPDDEPNRGIAANIAWTVPLVLGLVESLPEPERAPRPGLL